MTEISAPWDGVSLGDAANAPYSAAEWARIWRETFRASKADSGPLLGSGTSPDPGLTVQATTPASANVQVLPGSALVRGTWYANDANVTLPIAANASGNPRIDTVVLQKNVFTQTVRLVVLQGLTAVTPVPLPLTQLDVSVWEIPLADIAVASGFATITNANITPRRHWANLADGVYLQDVLNNSGGTLQTGDVVIWDTSADRAVTTTTTLGDAKTAGVWVGRTGAGGYGRVLVKGIGWVNTVGAAVRGYTLISYSTVKTAIPVASALGQSLRHGLGVVIGATTGTGLCLAMIDVNANHEGAIQVAQSTTVGGTQSVTFVDSHATHAVTLTPHGTRVKVTCMLSAENADAAKTSYYDLYSSGLAARAGDVNLGLQTLTGTTNFTPMTLVGIFTGLAPGVAQTFKLQLKHSDGTAWAYAYGPVKIYAEEI